MISVDKPQVRRTPAMILQLRQTEVCPGLKEREERIVCESRNLVNRGVGITRY
jgi:hypothetical protein